MKHSGRRTNSRHQGERPTIAFVVNSLRFFETHRMPLARAARAQGSNVIVAAPNDGANLQNLQSEGITVVPIAIPRRIQPAADLKATYLLARLFRKERPMLVHLVTLKAILIGGTAARLARVPAVVHAVTGLGHMFSQSQQQLRSRRLLLRASLAFPLRHPKCRVLCQNPEDAAFLHDIGLADDPVTIRGSGVDTDRFAPGDEPRGAFTVTLASRLLEGKGIRDFIAAAGVLQAHGIQCILAGSPDPGNPTSIAQSELQQWHRDGTVEVLGEVHDMVSLIQASHVVVLPSIYGEGVPKVLLEAASCGRALVGTDMPGIREVIIPDETGILIPPRDPQAIVNAILRLKKDPALRQRMARAARRMAVEEYDERLVAAQTLAVWETLVESTSPSPRS